MGYETVFKIVMFLRLHMHYRFIYTIHEGFLLSVMANNLVFYYRNENAFPSSFMQREIL